MGNQVESKSKRRLNKRKFVTAVGVFMFLGVISAAFALFTDDILVRAVKPAAAQNTKGSKGTVLKQPTEQSKQTKEGINAGKTVVLDAGHGGFDPGAIGAGGAWEDDLNLMVAEYLKEELESTGAKVVMTRKDGDALGKSKEEDFATRRDIINGSGADIVVSVHMNSHKEDLSCTGPIVLYMPGSVQGGKLAGTLQKSLNGSLKPRSPYKERQDNLFILRCGNQPCVVMECGFLSNAEEEEKLKQETYQKKIAKAACEGITGYFQDALKS